MAPPKSFPETEPQFHKARLQSPERLAALRASELMDTAPSEMFDRAVRIATRLTGSPVALLSLVDGQRQFFKAQTGLPDEVAEERQTPLSHSFCQYVVTADETLAVGDASEHPLLRDNSAVKDLGVRSYMGVPIHNHTGETLGSFCAIEDTPREWSEEDREALEDLAAIVEAEIALRHTVAERQLLVEELNHRVKNMFALVAGMIRMTARNSDSAEDLADALNSRVRALADAHELIVPVVNFEGHTAVEVSLQKLVATLIEPHLGVEADRVVIDGPPIMLGARAATSMSLAINEFATNAAKYGALSENAGKLKISWSHDGENAVLNWSEDGGPQVSEDPGKPGFGSKLIAISIQDQLKGKLETERRPQGIRHVVTLPMETLER
ncbi:HWE histidine kinase domain-containing protein [Tepidamorphus sp. 3E244]|uniref:HWE histidine kinase domain-containing protein n=1 Tax=Tepidamorphus sp. 3E244 TaxID=3385498 RepID=UPI0038FCD9AD